MLKEDGLTSSLIYSNTSYLNSGCISTVFMTSKGEISSSSLIRSSISLDYSFLVYFVLAGAAYS